MNAETNNHNETQYIPVAGDRLNLMTECSSVLDVTIEDIQLMAKELLEMRKKALEYSRHAYQIGQIKETIERFEKDERTAYGSRNLADKVAFMYNHFKHHKVMAESQFKHLREDMQVWSRAVGIVAAAIGNAGTHQEKNARIRGLIEMIESAVGAIRDSREYDDSFGFKFPDIFASDYPVREYKQRIYELEEQIKRLSKTDDDTDEPAF